MTNPNSFSLRLPAIDATRGIIMLLMLVDHVRETFYLHRNVSDPMQVLDTEPSLFVSRLLTHLCAPLFVFLTGMSAWLYAQRHQQPGALTHYLLTRGLILIALEITLINFSWVMRLPTVIYLQVIWAIGLAMLALAALAYLPRAAQWGVALLIIAGHNLLDGVVLPMDQPWQWGWAVLHQRALLPVFDGLSVRTSYPVLPWIGVMLLGFVAARSYVQAGERRRYLWWISAAMLGAFGVLRGLNGYGDLHAREVYANGWHTLMSFFNVTKYPPSLLFLLLTLGIGMALLRGMEQLYANTRSTLRWQHWLLTLGRVPLCFYVLHLYVVHGSHALLQSWLGANQGDQLGVAHVYQLWLLAVLYALLLYPLCAGYARLKQQHPHSWLRFF